MKILRANILGSPNVGVFTLSTDRCTIVPTGLTKGKITRISDALNTEIVSTDVGESKLVGVLAVANSNGILLPYSATENEIKTIRKHSKTKVKRCKSFKTLGNLVLANDHGALISSLLTSTEAKNVKDTLSVDVAVGCLAESPLVGSFAVATNKGVIVHPKATKDEQKLVSDILKVPVTIGTINNGLPLISSGVIVNSFGALVGTLTSGPELMVISSLV